MTYVAAEPKVTEAYLDQSGRYHETREGAIEANFVMDLREACKKMTSRDACSHIKTDHVYTAIVQFIKLNPDMVRVLLGDRDAT